MDETQTQLANYIAAKVVADTAFWVAIIGLIGVVIGAVISVFGNFALEWWRTRSARRLDASRKQLLLTLLNDPSHPWRSLATLARVIGVDDSTARRLLIEIEARGSERENEVWGLIARNPLDKTER